MLCPVCKEPLLIIEYDEVEVDYCVSGHGIWLDQGELEFVLGVDRILDLSDIQKSGKSKRRCPRCRKKMKSAFFPGTRVEIDLCDRDYGIWLDKGEINEIAKSKTAADSHKKISNFFDGLYGDEKEA
jgi:Zn-finger nucleic acid-binding protein